MPELLIHGVQKTIACRQRAVGPLFNPDAAYKLVPFRQLFTVRSIATVSVVSAAATAAAENSIPATLAASRVWRSSADKRPRWRATR